VPANAPRIGREVLVFVFRDSDEGRQVLLARRRAELSGFWHSIAGGSRRGESDEEAALRELPEETGLSEGAELGPRRHSYSYPVLVKPPSRRALYPPETESISVVCFRVDAPPGWEPILNREHDESRWCSTDEALALLRWPTVRQAFSALPRLD
jgi:8-oxo-dGTP pyrophosphatase MutT (NUDIX family)